MPLAFGALIACVFPACLSGQIRFNHLDRTDGLSQTDVESIYQDETGAMWFGTPNGLCRYNGSSMQVFHSSPEHPGLTRNDIRSITGNGNGAVYIKAGRDLIRYDIAKEQFRRICEGATAIFYGDGKLWTAIDGEVYVYSEDDGEMSLHSASEGRAEYISVLCVSKGGDVWTGETGGLYVIRNGSREAVMENIRVSSLLFDHEKLMWVGTENDGIHVLNGDGSTRWHFSHSPGANPISDNNVRTMIEDETGNVWAGTSFGLNFFDRGSGVWTSLSHDETNPGSLRHTSIRALYRDMQSTIWVGTYLDGISFFNPRTDVFEYFAANSADKGKLSHPFVGKMTEDAAGNLWICTEGGGLNRLDLRSRKFTRYLYLEAERRGHKLEGIYYDRQRDKLYVGIKNAGLGVIDLKSRKDVLYAPGLSVRDMQPYRNKIVALTQQGLYIIDPETDSIEPFPGYAEQLSTPGEEDHIYSFLIDSRDRLWFSKETGLMYINLNTGEKKNYSHDSDGARAVGKIPVSSMVETRDGELYFGTLGSGLFRYDPATDDFDNFTETDKTVIDDFCYHITETRGGNLLLLHGAAFSIFDPRTGSDIYRSTSNFPLSGFFDGNSSYVTGDGEIFIGGIDGLVSVKEADLTGSPEMYYRLYFDKLLIGGKPVSPGDGTKILSRTLSLTDKIRLRHDQNNFQVEFATSNYTRHDTSVDYQYRLEGLDENWNTASSETIFYTNIAPGKYRLRIREANPVGNDKIKTVALDITVSPPLYATVFAQIVYALLTVALIVGIIFFLMWRYRMRTSLKMEKREKEMKLGFFTGVSHEFRTPLTLILAQIEQMLSARDLDPNLKHTISKVHDNASHMRDLISELLDFRKVEQGFISLKVERIEMVRYIGEICGSFTEYAGKHVIKYVCDLPQEDIYVYADRAQFRKALYNLLSNAFKYTPDGGEITVRLRSDEYIRIEVEDNGIGISSEALLKIFDRFYQVEYRTSEFSLGTGIGLALTKEIIERHKGKISVRSTLNKGSVFEIKLKTGSAHFDKEELYLPPDVPETKSGEMPAPSDTNLSYSILIVEDNEQLLALLAEVFSGVGTVFTAANGRQGLELAGEHLPDIVLTDVMMPEMSGKEMCRRIKSDMKMSYIPVVMLTSLDSADETVDGYMFGADDYVVKPFNVEVLKARVGGIVRSRRSFFSSVTRSRELAGVEVRSEHDAAFMEKAVGIIRANFDNPQFDMNKFASEMGMGRNYFYTRMKDISGMTPNEFTMVTKLRESTELLRDHLHLNVSEISDRLGFSNIQYFIRCFKTFYGVTPGQWRKDNAR